MPSHTCHCQTTARRVAILFGGLEAHLPDFADFVAQSGGKHHPELSTVELTVGGECAPLASPLALREAIVDRWADYAPRLRCCWLEPGRDLDEQLKRLVAARALTDWAGAGHSPLQSVLEKRRINTYYQPVFAGPDLSLWGYECLARATDTDGTLLAPADLFRWAQQENLTFMLDRICREKHIENFAAADLPKHTRCLINFLPTVIYDPAVCLRTTFATARRVHLDPSRVAFEVVETERIADREKLRAILQEYRRAGFSVALDDVGAGHASLSLIGDLSPDIIKIDRSLVQRSVRSKVHAAICESIVQIGHTADTLVLAEGIETRAEFDFFRALGCDLFQGFLFAKPSPQPALTSAFQPDATVAQPKALPLT